MLRGEDITNVHELKINFKENWLEADFLRDSLKVLGAQGVSNYLSRSQKLKGMDLLTILSALIQMVFSTGHTIGKAARKNELKQGLMKDVLYRTLNSSKIDWRGLLWLLAKKNIRYFNKKDSQDSQSPRCLILDDTTLEKRGKKIEGISKVHDHLTHGYVLGFKLLLLGYWDGTSFAPLDFSIHRESKSRKGYGLRWADFLKQKKYKRKKGSLDDMRFRELNIGKARSALNMLQRALVTHRIKADYILTDSWFTTVDFIKNVSKFRGIHLIGMLQFRKTNYLHRGKQQNLRTIRDQLGKDKRCRRLKHYYRVTQLEIQGVKLKVFFTKRGKNGKWHVLATTDTDLTIIKVLEIYGIRWSIEVFFKECKQLLQLGKCHSNNFNAHVAHTTIVMIRYICVSMRHRHENYMTFGGMFEHMTDGLQELKLNQRIWDLFLQIIAQMEVKDMLQGDTQIVDNLLNTLVSKIEENINAIPESVLNQAA